MPCLFALGDACPCIVPLCCLIITYLQDVVAGDGTTSVTVLCGALLKKSLEMLEKGVHPTVISDAFGKAADKAVEVNACLLAYLAGRLHTCLPYLCACLLAYLACLPACMPACLCICFAGRPQSCLFGLAWPVVGK